ncbi:sulfite exporter TauE/SafE family protein [Ornithinimicrobium faecis]|uniref:Probable membrane transporter protein n=1 Tax=Ornithinimicrobium faecis TaxID=2934158 RepID=A0ABY4YSZ3_9MICO|nr:sulfite exporter TauE/SafE family protein [Ornithinimicrobium sp. HY1793]USQ79882.1 sulfite exporter TauE/SafE family protein [Ornithinimicrobium sp. HY1793]
MRNLIVLAVVGLFAQLVDGALGMGYGVTSSSLMIAVGIAPAAASAAVHLSEVGTTLISGFSHYKFGNVDWRIVGIMAVPGGVGAFIGANFLVSLPADVAKPWVALLLSLLGAYVLWRFLMLSGKRPEFRGKLRAIFLVPLGLVAGTMDAIGGGGWGPVGTTSLLSTGKLEPRKVIGSISATEFVVALSASLGFLFALGSEGINFAWVGALLIGGVIAAPIAAWLVRHLAATVLGVAAGSFIILTNTKTMMETWGGVEKNSTPIWITLGVLAVAAAWLITRAVRQELAARREAVADEPAPELTPQA